MYWAVKIEDKTLIQTATKTSKYIVTCNTIQGPHCTCNHQHWTYLHFQHKFKCSIMFFQLVLRKKKKKKCKIKKNRTKSIHKIFWHYSSSAMKSVVEKKSANAAWKCTYYWHIVWHTILLAIELFCNILAIN
jgi:hypothetical protein